MSAEIAGEIDKMNRIRIVLTKHDFFYQNLYQILNLKMDPLWS